MNEYIFKLSKSFNISVINYSIYKCIYLTDDSFICACVTLTSKIM